MIVPRLAPLAPPWPEEAAEPLEKLRFGRPEPLILFRTLAHNPRVLDRVRRGGLLDRGALAMRQREIVILRATARCGAEYEWGVHVQAFAAAAGLGEAQIAATVTGGADEAIWSVEERLLIRLVDSLHETSRIDDALYAELSAAFSPAQLVELVVLAGFYHSISFVVNAFALNLEVDAARFPRELGDRSAASA